MLKYPSPAVTEPMQISSSFLQLPLLNDVKEKVIGSRREVEEAWLRKVERSKNQSMVLADEGHVQA
jgi:hypothetical protein